MRIGYLSECDKDYSAALAGAASLDTLLTVVRGHRRIAADALEVVEGMSPADFKEFRRGLAKERKGQFAGEPWAEKYGAVMMPATMMHVSLVAIEFGCPWGVAFIRMVDCGRIKESGGIATVVAAPPTQGRAQPGGADPSPLGASGPEAPGPVRR